MPSRQGSEAWTRSCGVSLDTDSRNTTKGLRSHARVAHRGPANIYSASKAQSSGFFLIRPQLPLVFSHLKCNCFWATHRLAGTPEQVPVHSPRPPLLQVHLQRKPQHMSFLSLRCQEATALLAQIARVHEVGRLAITRFSRGNGGARTAGRLLRCCLQIQSNPLQPQAQGPPHDMVHLTFYSFLTLPLQILHPTEAQ